MKQKKLTYRELIEQIDKRNQIVIQEIQKNQQWISTVEYNLMWLINYILPGFLGKRFKKYCDKKRQELIEKNKTSASESAILNKNASKKGVKLTNKD